MERIAGEFRSFLPQLADHLGAFGGRQCALLLARGLRGGEARVPRPTLLVRAHAGHAYAALSRNADPAIYPLSEPRLDRQLPSAGGAEIPRRRCLLHFPPRAVFPYPAAGA